MYVEFKLDVFEKKPIEATRNAQGEYQFTDTGDEMIDRWEEQIANGEIPDLMEAFDQESIRHLNKLREAQRARDPYAGLSMKSMFDKIQNEASREGLHVGGKGQQHYSNMTPEKQKLLEGLFKNPTFGGNIDE